MPSPCAMLAAEAGVDIFARLGNAAAVAGMFGGVFASIAVRRAKYLEGKLAALRPLLLLQGIAAALLIAAILGQRHGPARLALGADAAAICNYLDALRDHDRSMTFYLACLPLLVLVSVPAVLHVLNATSSFVLQQRTDLLARDQAAGWTKAPR